MADQYGIGTVFVRPAIGFIGDLNRSQAVPRLQRQGFFQTPEGIGGRCDLSYRSSIHAQQLPFDCRVRYPAARLVILPQSNRKGHPRFEGLIEVGDDVLDVFDAHAQAHKVGGNPRGRLLFGAKLLVGG